jgi:hypothetical protein
MKQTLTQLEADLSPKARHALESYRIASPRLPFGPYQIDRSAHAHLERRFGVASDYGKPTETVRVSDAMGAVEFRVSGLDAPGWSNREEAIRQDDKIQEARAMCATYLKNNFPDYENPLAYWA